jgi:uncharacterized membrane protein
MVNGEFVLQWLHIFVSIFWFGSVLFADFVLMPGIARMGPAAQLEFGVNVGSRVSRFMIPAALLSIGLGIVRGVTSGDIGSVDDLLGTTYGLAWLVALVAGVATFALGMFVITPAVDGIARATSPEAAVAGIARVRTLTLVELAGFLVIFTAMIVMHYA